MSAEVSQVNIDVDATTVKLNTGAEMPLIGYGTKSISHAANVDVESCIRAALKKGYRHFDCAEMNGNQKEIGAALKKAMAALDISRDDLFITSKLAHDHHQPRDIEVAYNRTVEDLGVGPLDLYLIHMPIAIKKGSRCMPDMQTGMFFSPSVQGLAGTWAGMESLYERKLVKAIGVSNFIDAGFGGKGMNNDEFDGSNLLEEFIAHPDVKVMPAVHQYETHPLNVMDAMSETCRGSGIVVTASSPFGAGAALGAGRELKIMAHEKKCEPAQVLVQFQLNRGHAVIPRSSDPDNIKINFPKRDDGSARVVLSDSDMEELKSMNMGRRYNFDPWFTAPKLFTCARLLCICLMPAGTPRDLGFVSADGMTYTPAGGMS